jgi:sugar phosphate isomerase/epimerase
VSLAVWDDGDTVTDASLPRIQCSTGPFWAYELEVAMDALAEAGFTDIELMVTRDPRTQVPEIPLRLAEERGLRIASIHGPFLVITKSVWGLDPVEKITRGIDMCREVGADQLIVHPPYLWERNYARWVAEEAEAVETETGIKVAVETMYPKWVAGRRVRAYRWLEPKALALACHRVALDTSHLAVSREDIFDAFDILAPKLVHIHLSNNNGDGRDGHLEVEKGILPIGRFLEHVTRAGYKGVISLELSVRKYLQRPKELSDMLKRNREYVEEKLLDRPKMAKGMPR